MGYRRSFNRQTGQRDYRKLFLICTEGRKTEPQYFRILWDSQYCNLKLLKSKHSDPLSLLRTMRQGLKENQLKSRDEAWIVLDRDLWTDEQFEQIFLWAQEKENYYIALSNPNFEYWLLLHFEDGNSVDSCAKKLRQHCPGYDKQIERGKFTEQRIKDAIERAKKKGLNNNLEDYLNINGTTVYLLVEKILNLNNR